MDKMFLCLNWLDGFWWLLTALDRVFKSILMGFGFDSLSTNAMILRWLPLSQSSYLKCKKRKNGKGRLWTYKFLTIFLWISGGRSWRNFEPFFLPTCHPCDTINRITCHEPFMSGKNMCFKAVGKLASRCQRFCITRSLGDPSGPISS